MEERFQFGIDGELCKIPVLLRQFDQHPPQTNAL